MNRARIPTFLLAGAVSFGLAAAASGDVFYLSNGGRIEGQLLNPDQSPRASYQVRLPWGGELTLAGSQVERVVVKSEIERQYEAILPTLPDTVAAHLDMADRCGRARLEEQRLFHLEQVVRLDPDHEAARHALGYSRVGGRWLRQEDWMAKQGYVRHRGQWKLPQELEIEKVEDAEENATIEWRKKLKTWRSWIVKGRDNARQGEAEFRALRDPRAAPALAELLDRDKEPTALKLLYISVLGEIPCPAAVDACIRRAIEDSDAKVRDACLDQLVRFGSKTAVKVFIAKLNDDDRVVIHRAAEALGRLQDKEATLPLIEALVTEHTVLVSGGGGLNPTFSDQGGGGLAIGGRPKYEEREFQNEPVLHALTVLHRGVNFRFNEQAWKAWYVEQHKPRRTNLRRDE